MEKELKVDYIKRELVVDNITVGELIDFLADVEDVVTDDYKIVSNSGKEYYPVYFATVDLGCESGDNNVDGSDTKKMSE